MMMIPTMRDISFHVLCLQVSITGQPTFVAHAGYIHEYLGIQASFKLSRSLNSLISICSHFKMICMLKAVFSAVIERL